MSLNEEARETAYILLLNFHFLPLKKNESENPLENTECEEFQYEEHCPYSNPHFLPLSSSPCYFQQPTSLSPLLFSQIALQEMLQFLVEPNPSKHQVQGAILAAEM